MSDALRELLAVFDIQVDDRALKEGDKHVESFKENLEKVIKIAAEAFAVKEVYEFVESQIEAAAHVQDLSNRLDVAASSLADWAFVAKSAGVDADSAGRSLGFLEKSIGDAMRKGGDAARPFGELHVALKAADGAARPLLDVLGDVAEGISKLPDQNQRAAVAMDLFGREGRSLLPILTQGKDAMREMLEEAGELSNGLGDEYYKAAKDAEDQTLKIGRAWQSTKELALAAMLPAVMKVVGVLKDGAKWLLEHAKNADTMRFAVTALGIVVGVGLVSALLTAAAAAATFLAPMLPLAAAIVGVTTVVLSLSEAMNDGEDKTSAFASSLGGLSELWSSAKEAASGLAYAIGYLAGAFAALEMKMAGDDPHGSFLESVKNQLGTLTKYAVDAAVGFERLLRVITAVSSAFKLDKNGYLDPSSYGAAGKAFDKSMNGFAKDDWLLGKLSSLGSVPTDVTAHGVDPRSVELWNQMQHDRRFNANTKEGRDAGYQGPPRAESPMLDHYDKENDLYYAPQTVPGPTVGAGGAGGVGGVTVHNKTDVVVHAAPDHLIKEMHDAVDSGVSTGSERALNNALQSVRRP